MTEEAPRLTLRHGWDALVLGAAVALAFVIPLRVASFPSQPPLTGPWESLVTLLFSLDFLVKRRKGGGVGVVQPGRSAWGWVAIDLLAALPLGPMLQLPPATRAGSISRPAGPGSA